MRTLIVEAFCKIVRKMWPTTPERSVCGSVIKQQTPTCHNKCCFSIIHSVFPLPFPKMLKLKHAAYVALLFGSMFCSGILYYAVGPLSFAESSIHQFMASDPFQISSNDQTEHTRHYHYIMEHRKPASPAPGGYLLQGLDNSGQQLLFRRRTAFKQPIYRVQTRFIARPIESIADDEHEHEEVVIGNAKKPPPKTDLNPCLPQVLVIGSQKGGTTSWHVYLKQMYHPRILVPQAAKELDFFNKKLEFGGTFEEYLSAFPGNDNRTNAARECSLKFDSNGRHYIRTEASPNYLVHPYSAERASKYLPDVKIVVMLRNPITRLVSAFNMKWQERVCGKEAWHSRDCYKNIGDQKKLALNWATELRQLVERELAILEPCYYSIHKLMAARREKRLNVYNTGLEVCFRYKYLSPARLWMHLEDDAMIMRSLYVDQLSRWFDKYSASSFLVWSSEEFERNPKAHMKKFVEFVGEDTNDSDESVIDYKHHQRDYITEIPDDVKMRLLTFFQSHNERLFELLKSKGGFDNVLAQLKKHFETY